MINMQELDFYLIKMKTRKSLTLIINSAKKLNNNFKKQKHLRKIF